MRVVQLSDPHLVASPTGLVRGRPALRHWQRGLQEALLHRPDLLLISGDCCHDESWNGYAVLRDSLASLPANTAVAVVPGNHDHPQRLQAALGRRATVAPAALALGQWTLILLSSHTSGRVDGALGEPQRSWLATMLQTAEQEGRYVLIGLHHPPLSIGDPSWDQIGLRDAESPEPSQPHQDAPERGDGASASTLAREPARTTGCCRDGVSIHPLRF